MGQDILNQCYFGFPVDKVFKYLSANGLQSECEAVEKIIEKEELRDFTPFGSTCNHNFPAIGDLYKKIAGHFELDGDEFKEDYDNFGLLAPSTCHSSDVYDEQVYFVFGNSDDDDGDFPWLEDDFAETENRKWPKAFGKLKIIRFSYLSI